MLINLEAKKMYKKIIIIILVALTVLSLVSCNKKEKAPEPTATPTATEKSNPTPNPTASPEPTVAPTRVPDPEVDALITNFYYENDIGYELLGNIQQCDYEWVEGKGLAVYPSSEDPWIQIIPETDKGEQINIKSYPVLKIRLMNNTPGTTFEAFLKRSDGDITGDDLFQTTIVANSTEYVDVIINLIGLKGEAFVNVNEGIVTDIRLDCVNLSTVKAQIEEAVGDKSFVVYVDYIGFFKTEAEAKNWNPTHVTAK